MRASLERIAALDRQWSTQLAIPHELRRLRPLALVLAHSGDSPLWLLGAVAALVWGNKTWRDFGWRALVGTLAAGAAVTSLKWLFRRQRPQGKGWGFYSRLDRHAFPSGHAGRSACQVVLLGPLLPTWGCILLALWAGLVGLARVGLRVHFLSDIASGWGVGLLVGMVLKTAL